jgi:hypothetical protein
MADVDTSFRQSAVTKFLFNQELQTSDDYAHFNEYMETPTWALSVSDDRNGILKTGKPTTPSAPYWLVANCLYKKICELIRQNRHVIVREISAETDIRQRALQETLEFRRNVNFVPVTFLAS